MPNLRIIYKNIADTATISASSTAGSLTASNMQNDIKGKVHRSTGLTVTYTLTWPTAQKLTAVCLPAHNLSQNAIITVNLYTNNAATILAATSGARIATPGSNNMWNWNPPLNANTFAFGGVNKTTVWFPQEYSNIRAVKITLADSSTNTLGYIDCARLVIGSHWEPKQNVQNGSLQMSPQDTSTTTRTDAGDLISSRSIVYDTLSLSTAYLPEADRASFYRILKQGSSKYVLLSVFPNTNNSTLEADHTIYGRLAQTSTSQPYYGYFDIPIEIESW